MEFRIADTFLESLARLTGEEQKVVKTTAFDLQMQPAQPSMQLHRLDKARDANFWSVRVSRDLRVIVHRTASSLLLCYVDHHDAAYRWAERRKLETHPQTGAAQFVEIRQTVQEIHLPTSVEAASPPPATARLFEHVAEEALLHYGVPTEWLPDVRQATEDTLLQLADHLPREASEALLELATGGKPPLPQPVPTGTDPFAHPDAQRRFRVMHDVEELARALDYPWEQWTVFLHPAQRQLVEGTYNGPVRVAGSAGTGKTVVALHRAVFLARAHPEARTVLTTFSDTLANALRTKLRRLISHAPRLAERLEVHALPALGRHLYTLHFGQPRMATRAVIQPLLTAAASTVHGHTFSPYFLLTEWEEVVDAWQLDTWEAYRDVRRLGRKTRLPEPQRAMLWAMFADVRTQLASQGYVTDAGIFHRLSVQFVGRAHPPFDFTVVDEAQDLSVAQLRFLAALGTAHPDSLFFAGDLGQRIFQTPFSWRALGIDIRGRSRTLHINYRTSHQIRRQADRLLGPTLADVDGNIEQRSGTISVFNGPPPTVRVTPSAAAESQLVGTWLGDRMHEGIMPHEMGVFVRSPAALDRARAAVAYAGLPYTVLDEHVETTHGHVSISTMHLVKGLEFRAVVVMACDDEVIPSQARIETVADDADLEEVYNTERHLLYVACTRARDHLLVTGVDPPSEFLDDLRL
jgi:mRNA-degrading endonuclease RelE of RelBE toxin-antitoxin system